MNIFIITTNKESQAEYWQKYFDAHAKEGSIVLVVDEDWPGGAGNGYGTLYAFQKAVQLAKKKHSVDLIEALYQGHAVSLFHCAGRGKRLYPLTASENNNKSSIKLPSSAGCKTLLEFVLENIEGQRFSFPGRLSVFWGDQIFLSERPLQQPAAHASLFTKFIPFPTFDEWKEQNLDHYGLVLLNQKGECRLMEKISYSTLEEEASRFQSGGGVKVGLSLGSFSISIFFLEALLNTFKVELAARKGRLNTDYHFWMPLTWPRDDYLNFIINKGYPGVAMELLYDRMHLVKDHVCGMINHPIFSVMDIGADAPWWDFGSLNSYISNLHSILRGDISGRQLAQVLGIAPFYDPIDNNIIINSHVEEMNVKNSIIVNTTAKKITASKALVINCQLNKALIHNATLYNVSEKNDIVLHPHEVRSDVFFSGDPKQVALYTEEARNGKMDWEVILPKNTLAYKDVCALSEILPVLTFLFFR